MKQIFLHEPHFHSNEISNIKKCIKSGWVSTGGKFVKDFEEKYQILLTQNTQLH